MFSTHLVEMFAQLCFQSTCPDLIFDCIYFQVPIFNTLANRGFNCGFVYVGVDLKYLAYAILIADFRQFVSQ